MDQYVTIIFSFCLFVVGIILGGFKYVLNREIERIDEVDRRMHMITSEINALLQDHRRDHEDLIAVKKALITLSEDSREINTKLNLIYQTIQVRFGIKDGGEK